MDDPVIALYNAIEANDLKRIKLLVKQSADKNDLINDDSYSLFGEELGYTPLYVACASGFLKVAQYLVEQGAILDKPDNNGNTPLNAATAKGQKKIVRYLFGQGANREI